MKCNLPVFCDVDDTLVMWNMPEKKDGLTIMDITYNGITAAAVINVKQVDELRKHAARGHTIIVWSHGGAEWADAVVDALGLRPIVALTLEKPRFLYDDLQPEEFMPKAKYFPVPGLKD